MIGKTGNSKTKATWMDIALGEIGVAEIPGDLDNSRIVEYHSSTTLRASDDETPWCAAFANWVLKQAGIEGTDSAAALSFKSWGVAVKPSELCYGDICVMDRGGGRGHVGFYVGRDRNGKILLLGGNQSNEVNTTPYDIKSFAYFRRPKKLSDTKTAKIIVAGAATTIAAPPIVDSIISPQMVETAAGFADAVMPGYGDIVRIVATVATACAVLFNRFKDLKTRGI